MRGTSYTSSALQCLDFIYISAGYRDLKYEYAKYALARVLYRKVASTQHDAQSLSNIYLLTTCPIHRNSLSHSNAAVYIV